MFSVSPWLSVSCVKFTTETQRGLSRNAHDPRNYTKHHELRFVLVWFRVDSCGFVDRFCFVKTLRQKQDVADLLHSEPELLVYSDEILQPGSTNA